MGKYNSHVIINCIRICRKNINRGLTHFAVSARSRCLGLDHYTRGTRVHEHLTPRVIRLVVATTHFSAGGVLTLSRSFRFRARQIARHAPRTSGLFLDQTFLTALAAHSGTRGRFYVETHESVILYDFIYYNTVQIKRGGLGIFQRIYSLILHIPCKHQ